MISQFAELTQEEEELMYKIPVLATILIAGADDNIDKIEKHVAEELTRFKSFTSEPHLRDYFNKVSQTFREDLEATIKDLPDTAKFRNPYIREQLTKVNEILPKINPIFGMEFYKSIKDIAQYVAEASGGVLGYMSVSKEEARALNNLDLILKPKYLD